LTQATALPEYATFASTINEGMWNGRHDFDTYLLPAAFSNVGPILGPDRFSDVKDPNTEAILERGLYQAGTDAIYWTFGVFEAYGLVGPARPDLRPDERSVRAFEDLVLRAPDFDRFWNIRQTLGHLFLHNEIDARRERVAELLDGAFPAKYLGMALGLTLDWIKYGWRPKWGHFVNRLSFDGTSQSNSQIGSDSKYNTLQMLVDAYRFTYDDFYLRIFDAAWATFEQLGADGRLGGFFPETVFEGHLVGGCTGFGEELNVDDPNFYSCWDPRQDVFLEIRVRAYLATVAAGQPRAEYLESAQAFANRIIDHEAQRVAVGCDGIAFLRLALATGTLRRIQFTIWEDAVALTCETDGGASPAARSDGSAFRRAVFYMDPGEYVVHYRRPDNTESESIGFVIGSEDRSIHIQSDRLLIGEEGIA
jgi:hypothetical protein